MNKAGYRESTLPLFIKSHCLKFDDLVYIKTLETVYRVGKNTLPVCIRNMFVLKEQKYNLRSQLNYTRTITRSHEKGRCVSVLGVKLWNDLRDDLKACRSLQNFKKALKCEKLHKYTLQ